MCYDKYDKLLQDFVLDSVNVHLQKVTKQYAFEKVDVPVESDYLEIRFGVNTRCY